MLRILIEMAVGNHFRNNLLVELILILVDDHSEYDDDRKGLCGGFPTSGNILRSI